MMNLLNRMQEVQTRKQLLFIPLITMLMFAVLAVMVRDISELWTDITFLLSVISSFVLIINTSLVLYSDYRCNFIIYSNIYGRTDIKYNERCTGINIDESEKSPVIGFFHGTTTNDTISIIRDLNGELQKVHTRTIKLL